MWKHWLAPGLLATKLGRGEISNTEVAYFMLGNLLLGTAIYYSGAVWGNPLWTALSLWEGALVVIVTVYGMISCFEAAGGETNSRFAAQFSCLSFPIWLWTTIAVWSTFWIVSSAYGKWALSLISSNKGFVELIAYISGRFEWVLTMCAIVGSQIIFFAWMRSMMRKMERVAAAAVP